MLMDQYTYLFLDVGNILFHDIAVEMVFNYWVYCKLNSKLQFSFFKVRNYELKKRNLSWLYEYCRKNNPECAEDILRVAWEIVIENWIDINIPIKSAIEAVYQISKYIPISIAANQPVETETLLKKYGITDMVEYVLLDSNMGVSKPKKEFFDQILSITSQSAADVLFLGDRIDNDIIPAYRNGMTSIWIQYKPIFVKSTLVPNWWAQKFCENYSKVAPFNLWKFNKEFNKNITPYKFKNLHSFTDAYISKKI